MIAAERLQAEKERLLTTTGFYVPPYRMANLMKAAAKIMDRGVQVNAEICKDYVIEFVFYRISGKVDYANTVTVTIVV